MVSLQINQTTLATVSERIFHARQLHGKDSSYVIGIFAGIQMLAGDDETLRQLRARVLDLEGGKATASGSSRSTSSGGERRGPEEPQRDRARGEGLAENTWIRGSVKWFNNDKGYGFISTDADTDVFVHWRDISSWDRSLTQGDPVEFMVTKTAKGFQAINVMKPDAEAGTEEAVRESPPGAPEPAQDTEAGEIGAEASGAPVENPAGEPDGAVANTEETESGEVTETGGETVADGAKTQSS